MGVLAPEVSFLPVLLPGGHALRSTSSGLYGVSIFRSLLMNNHQLQRGAVPLDAAHVLTRKALTHFETPALRAVDVKVEI